MAGESWLQEYLAAWNTRDGQRVAEWMADDATYEDVALGQTHTGRQAIAAFVDGMTGFSTDYRFEPVSAFSTDANYVSEWELSGTHDGDAAGLPATGRPYRIRGVSVGTLSRGKIARNRDYWNMADFLVQVGVLPPPG
jgi:steroid delta-isomerase-like uncharacterized protein